MNKISSITILATIAASLFPSLSAFQSPDKTLTHFLTINSTSRDQSIADYEAKLLLGLSFDYGVVTIGRVTALVDIEIRFQALDPFVTNLKESFEFRFAKRTQRISLKLRDICKLGNGRQEFRLNPSSFEEVVGAIENSGYAHEESAAFIATIPEGRKPGFVTSIASYSERERTDFQSVLIIETLRASESGVPDWETYCPFCPAGCLVDLNRNGRQHLPGESSWAWAKLQEKVNWNGYGSLADVHQVPSTPDAELSTAESHECLREPYLPFNSADKTAKAYYNYRKCSSQYVILHALSKRLNVTTRNAEPLFHVEDEQTSIIIHTALLMDHNLFAGSKILTVNSITIIFGYCEKAVDYVGPGWNFFLRPFDGWIWVCLAATGVAYALVNGRNPRHGLDILWTIVGQDMQMRHSKLLFGITLVLIVVSYAYTGVISSSVIAPLPKKIFTTVRELADQGYKIVAPEKSSEIILKKMISPWLNGHNITPDEICCHFEEGSVFLFPSDKFMIENKGLVFHLKKAEFDKYKLYGGSVGQSESDSILCHNVDEPLRENEQQHWTFYSYLSGRAVQLMSYLAQSGFTTFWHKRTLERIVTEEVKINRKQYQDLVIRKLNMSAHTTILFKLFLIELGISTLSFLVEWCYGKRDAIFEYCIQSFDKAKLALSHLRKY